jgi:cytochrome P450
MTGYRALARYFERLAARKRACRGDGSLIACLTRAEADGVVNHAELIGNLIFFSAAAYQTTRMMAGALARLLWLFPDQRGPLIATPAHIAAAIEEGLRMEGPVHVVNRILTEDVTLRGVTMRSGQRVGLCVASANRCEEKFADGDTFDITRGRTDSLAFGSGIHACLGGAVARRTLRLLFQHLLSVAPDYVIEPDRTRFCVGQVGAGEDFLWGLAALPMSRSSLGAAPAVA